MKTRIGGYKRILVTQIFSASTLAIATTAVIATPTAFAAPQGSCTTGNYIETTVGSDTVGSFGAPAGASSTGCQWTVPAGVTGVRVLVVAGGGGGGGNLTSGGGGGGGVLHEVGYAVTPGDSINVTIGKGGAAGSNAWNLPNNLNNGVNGDNSVFGSLTAIGGGGGGGGGTNSQRGNPGSAGGSGGGGGRCWVHCNTSTSTSNGNKRLGGAATSGQGNRGGDAPFMSGAGGGGAGAAGSASTGSAAGNGGDGVSIDISGAGTYFGGGGGGGTESAATRASGGLGGGGLGAVNGIEDGDTGTDGRGGGGGGTRTGSGGIGGSGVVIIRWGSAPIAPSISLSSSSGFALTNSAVGSLYTISNTGGTVTSYSIAPALPAGLSFSTVTGLISGTPTALSSATNHTITARRVDANNGASSSDTAVFNLEVVNVAPTTTTPSTTTVAPVVTSAPTSASESNVVDTNTNVIASPQTTRQNSTVATVAPPVVSTTTVPPTTTTTIPAPSAPELSSGEAGALVDGEEVETTLTRSNNALVVSGAGIEASVYGMSPEGARIDLDEDGLLRLDTQDQVVVEAEGYEAGNVVDVWMYSTPTRLGQLTVDAAGLIQGSFLLPESLETGDHRVVLDGQNSRGQEVILGIGVSVGEVEQSSLLSRLLIIVPVSLAILAALIIPTTLRRRREDLSVN
jgi:hypothetical protein